MIEFKELAKRMVFALVPPFRRLRDSRDALVAQQAQMALEHEALNAQQVELIAERNMLKAGYDALAAQKVDLAAERDALAAERDALTLKLNESREQHVRYSADLSLLHSRFISPLSTEVGQEPYQCNYLPSALTREGEVLHHPPYGLLRPYFDVLNVEVDPDKPPRLNVFLPSTRVEHNSGGPNTMYLLGSYLAQAGVPLRFVAVTAPAGDDNDPIRNHMANLSGISREHIDKIEFADATDRNQVLSFAENDMFFATAWWTAQMIKYLLPRFRQRSFFYLIQDYEPNLHTVSYNSAMAFETYFMDYFPVVNSRLLFDYFLNEKIGRFADEDFSRSGCWFDPSVDRTMYYPRPRADNRKRRLLFYARPDAPRNLAEFGLAALTLLIREGDIKPEEWDLHTTMIGVGGHCRPISLSQDGSFMLNPLPLHELSVWAAEMRQTDVLLSLIWSPHTSYPPLEAAASGAVVATNTCGVKTAERLRQISGNIFAGPPTVEGIAQSLRSAIARVGDWNARVAGAELSSPETWLESFQDTIPMILKRLEECGLLSP